MDGTFRIRQAIATDAATIASHRRLMFQEAGHYETARLDDMEVRFLEWLRPKLATGEYKAWFVTDVTGDPVAGVGLWVRDWLVNPNYLSGKRGHVVNVYTHPVYRRRGFAQSLMQELFTWCQEHKIHSLFLNPTEEARTLYQQIGFEPEDTMSLRLPE